MRPFCIALLLLAPACAAPCFAQEKSWVGETIIPIRPGIQIAKTSEEGQQVVVGKLNNLHYRVIADGNGLIKVKDGRGNEGWFPRTEAVLLSDATAVFSDLIRQNPNSTDYYSRRGVAARLLGKVDEAIADFSEVVRLKPSASAYNNRGTAYEVKRDWDKSIADFSEAIRINPNYFISYFNRGLAWSRKKDYDRAIADFTRVIQIEPKYVSAYSSRAACWDSKKDYNKTVADYSEALRLDPANPSYFNNRGNAFRNLKQYDKAIADYGDAIRLSPNKAIYFTNRGAALARKQDFKKAIADHKEAIRIDPKYTQAYYNLAACHALQGRTDPALQNLRTALELGYRNFAQIARDTDLDSIRGDPVFEKLLAEFRK